MIKILHNSALFWNKNAKFFAEFFGEKNHNIGPRLGELFSIGSDFFLPWGSVIPFPLCFCYRQIAILLRLLGITIIISSPYHYKEHLILSLVYVFGDCLLWAVTLKMTKIVQNYLTLRSVTYDRIKLSYLLAIFFTNSSGRPGGRQSLGNWTTLSIRNIFDLSILLRELGSELRWRYTFLLILKEFCHTTYDAIHNSVLTKKDLHHLYGDSKIFKWVQI
jgi:hypothetical protein